MARRLAREEGIFCGISTAATWPPRSSWRGATRSCPRSSTIINDTGQRYFTTPLCGEAKHVEIPEREHPARRAHASSELADVQGALGDPR